MLGDSALGSVCCAVVCGGTSYLCYGQFCLLRACTYCATSCSKSMYLDTFAYWVYDDM
jgi:hypothetical protein